MASGLPAAISAHIEVVGLPVVDGTPFEDPFRWWQIMLAAEEDEPTVTIEGILVYLCGPDDPDTASPRLVTFLARLVPAGTATPDHVRVEGEWQPEGRNLRAEVTTVADGAVWIGMSTFKDLGWKLLEAVARVVPGSSVDVEDMAGDLIEEVIDICHLRVDDAKSGVVSRNAVLEIRELLKLSV